MADLARPKDAKDPYLSCPHLTLAAVSKVMSSLRQVKDRYLGSHGNSHICLSCSQIGDISNNEIFRSHFVGKCHPLALRVASPQELFCFICNDYQFCSVLDRLVGRKRPFPSVSKRDKSDSICTAESLASSSSSRSHTPRGLVNMGSTCFMNSVLQVLCAYPPLIQSPPILEHVQSCAVFRSRLGPKVPKVSHSKPEGLVNAAPTCIPCELKVTSEYLWNGNSNGKRASYPPSDLLYSFWKHVDYMAGYAQQDAHEFLIAFLACLEDQLCGNNDTSHSKDEFRKVFSGRVRSRLKCSSCCYSSFKEENFVDLNLSINSGANNRLSSGGKEAESLYDCLTYFTISEDLSQKMLCEQCKVERVFSKQLSILESPDFLILHLKRFDFLQQQKITQMVTFALENFDISPFCTTSLHDGTFGDEMKGNLYNLQGLVCHTGSLHQGHYISYVKKTEDNLIDSYWVKCDDDKVSIVTAQEVEKAEG